MCVCGNFQEKRPWESFYTANTDISSIRVVLSEAAQQKHWGVSSLDVATAFLNAPMPKEEDETIYVKPPALLAQLHLVKIKKAAYGLRVRSKSKPTSLGQGARSSVKSNAVSTRRS